MDAFVVRNKPKRKATPIAAEDEDADYEVKRVQVANEAVPLAERVRPQKFEDISGQDSTLGKVCFNRRAFSPF